jgi:hypothetical protein
VHTDLDERRIWSVRENCSAFGKVFVASKILIACSKALRYTVNSLKLLIIW